MSFSSRHIKESLRALSSEDALEPASAPMLSAVPSIFADDKRKMRRHVLVLVPLIAVVFFLSLCVGVTSYEVISPVQVCEAIALWAKTTAEGLLLGSVYSTTELMDACPWYFQVTTRAVVSCMSIVCGIILTVSGMIYQGVFRNPITAPTMLGVGSGVSMGLLVFTAVYGSAAYYATLPHLLYGYAGAVVVLAVVLLGSRLINGKKGFSVVDMLLVGSIVSQVLGQIALYVQYYVFDEATWLVYTNVSQVLTVDTDPLAVAFLALASILTFVPVYAVRFKLNALSFTVEESAGLGVDLNRMRYAVLVPATIMCIAAMVHVGMVGMVALVVPFVARAFFGAEFRKQALGNMLLGAAMLLTCRCIADLLSIYIHSLGFVFNFPVGIVSSLICMPLFVWILAIQQRTWE